MNNTDHTIDHTLLYTLDITVNIPITTILYYNILAPDLIFTAPTKGNNGYDLPSNEDVCIRPKEIAIIHTGICVQMPPNVAGLIIGRSGLAFNHSVFILHNGLIDNNYRGEIKVILFNQGDVNYYVKRHDRIAQLLLVHTNRYEVELRELETTERNDKGFGSSGR